MRLWQRLAVQLKTKDTSGMLHVISLFNSQAWPLNKWIVVENSYRLYIRFNEVIATIAAAALDVLSLLNKLLKPQVYDLQPLLW